LPRSPEELPLQGPVQVALARIFASAVLHWSCSCLAAVGGLAGPYARPVWSPFGRVQPFENKILRGCCRPVTPNMLDAVESNLAGARQSLQGQGAGA
jgi:hypothetical protein